MYDSFVYVVGGRRPLYTFVKLWCVCMPATYGKACCLKATQRYAAHIKQASSKHQHLLPEIEQGLGRRELSKRAILLSSTSAFIRPQFIATMIGNLERGLLDPCPAVQRTSLQARPHSLLC